jgi:hypothetical protein
LTKRKKRPRDSNQLGKSLIATGETKDREPTSEEQGGGLKGGKARAASMSANRRSQTAKAAAKAKWKRR